MDGPAARDEHLRVRLVSLIAFSYSFVAMATAVMAWGIELGVATAANVRLLVLH